MSLALFAAVGTVAHAQTVPPVTVCVYDDASKPLRFSIVEFMDPVTGRFEGYSTGLHNCVTSGGIAVGTEEVPTSSAVGEIIAWPNPATSDYTNLELTLVAPMTGRLSIFTVDGRLVSRGEIQSLPAGKHITELDLSALPQVFTSLVLKSRKAVRSPGNLWT